METATFHFLLDAPLFPEYFCAGVKKPLQFRGSKELSTERNWSNKRGQNENYIWSETFFLEKRKTSYVGSSRERNVSLSVARPKPVKESIIDRILFISNTAPLLVCLCYIVNRSKGYPLALENIHLDKKLSIC